MSQKSLDTILHERRSVRRYLDKPVEEEKLHQLAGALQEAPSACNAQPWRLVIVDDREIKNELVAQGLGGVVPNAWALTAPVMLVVCSSTSFFTHTLGELAQGVQYHLIDIGIAAQQLVLKATELGLGTCYIGWFKPKPIRKLLRIPSSWDIQCLITLGYPQEVPEPTKRKPLDEIVFYNTATHEKNNTKET